MDKKWRKSIFQLLPLNGRYFLTVALKFYPQRKPPFPTNSIGTQPGGADMQLESRPGQSNQRSTDRLRSL